MRLDKNRPGYIKRYKRINFIWLIVWVAVGIALFFFGLMIAHTRANVFTVLAILMVLPAAKRIVALAVSFGKHSVSIQRADKVLAAISDWSGENHCDDQDVLIYTDYMFTSTDKVMMLDFLIVISTDVIAVFTEDTKDKEYIKKYLTDGVKKLSSSHHVIFLDNDDKAIKRISHTKASDIDPIIKKSVIDWLESLAV